MGERTPEDDPTFGVAVLGQAQAILAGRTGTLEERTVALEHALSQTLDALTDSLRRLHRLEVNVGALLALVARSDQAVEAAPLAQEQAGPSISSE